MKPLLFALGVGAAWFCFVPAAEAQKPLSDFAMAPAPAPWLAPKEWGTLPPPKPLPYGYWWDEYRGADIEHPLYAPRHAHHVGRAYASSNVLTELGCWFHKLFHCNGAASSACEACQQSAVPPPPLPAYLPPGLTSPPPEPFSLQPIPHILQPPAELQRPADSAPTQPQTPPEAFASPPHLLLPDPPRTTTPEPAKIVDVPPAIPVPAAPSDSVDSSERQLPASPAPLVELAPEYSLPAESAPTAPKNVIPAPPQTVPRNVIPPRKRGILPAL